MDCPLHQENALWECGQCGQPLCKTCKPIAWHYRVYHPDCLSRAHQAEEKKARIKPLDAPSPGVRAVAWLFLLAGILFLGAGLLLLGFGFFSQALPVRALLTSAVPPLLDTIPGGRTALFWVATGCLAVCVLLALAGMGLLNCIPAVRKTLLVLAWIELVVGVAGWMVVWILGQGFWDIPLPALFLIVFFSRKRVKQQFLKSA